MTHKPKVNYKPIPPFSGVSADYFMITLNYVQDENDPDVYLYSPTIHFDCHSYEGERKDSHAVSMITRIASESPYDAALEAIEIAQRFTTNYIDEIQVFDLTNSSPDELDFDTLDATVTQLIDDLKSTPDDIESANREALKAWDIKGLTPQ